MTIWPDGYGRCVLAEVDSTLDEARRQAPHLSGPTWILAHHQTSARGRRGRAWQNPPGNFAATLCLQPKEPLQVAVLRSFVAALALFDAIADVTGRPENLGLKWPNDVLLNGGKLAGILLESAGQGTGLSHLSIGIGVNLIAAPPAVVVEKGAVRPVSLKQEMEVTLQPDVFLTHLAAAYATHEHRFLTYGFEPIRTLWRERAARLGETITARTGKETHSGVFADVDKDGQLVLETPQGSIAIPAADVFF